jgi:hypothetical protein
LVPAQPLAGALPHLPLPRCAIGQCHGITPQAPRQAACGKRQCVTARSSKLPHLISMPSPTARIRQWHPPWCSPCTHAPQPHPDRPPCPLCVRLHQEGPVPFVRPRCPVSAFGNRPPPGSSIFCRGSPSPAHLTASPLPCAGPEEAPPPWRSS